MINFLFKKHFIFKVLFILALQIAGVVELVDTLDLGSSAARCGSSSLPARTKQKKSFSFWEAFFMPCFFILNQIISLWWNKTQWNCAINTLELIWVDSGASDNYCNAAENGWKFL